MNAATKRLFIKTYGCQMNVYDSERMKDVLAPLGYVTTETADDADLVLLNTCHIREKATEKVFSELGQLKRLKQKSGGKMLLGVTGCVAQAGGVVLDERRRAEACASQPPGGRRCRGARRLRSPERALLPAL